MKLCHLASACSLTVLLTALPAMARTTVTESGDNYLVNMGDGCVIVMDRHGREKSSSDQCSSRDIRDAEDAVDDYRHGRDNSRDYDRGHSHSSSHSSGRVYYEVHRGSDNNLRLRKRPSEDSDALVRNIRNGEVVRGLGDCEEHNGKTWCEVEYDDERGWAKKKYLRETSSSHSSSHYRDDDRDRHSSRGGDDLQDLKDMRVSRGEDELEDMGYRYEKRIEGKNGDIEYWWNRHDDQCVAINVKDGRYVAVTKQPEAMCGR